MKFRVLQKQDFSAGPYPEKTDWVILPIHRFFIYDLELTVCLSCLIHWWLVEKKAEKKNPELEDINFLCNMILIGTYKL